MNQPTREEFEELKKELKEEVRQLREQITEPMKVVKVEVASEDVLNRLKALEQGQQELKQEFHTVSNTWLDTLQEHYNDHTARFEKIESTMATKEDLTAFATKEDLATLKTAQDAHFDQIEAEQKEQHDMLRQILRLLGQKD
ncbi:MAG TPA: hypothetical protein VN207_12665 [Ktedonobacteraceae bacterium]|nr:hypothetical protein [Ktedonobacteraceae bacterium]